MVLQKTDMTFCRYKREENRFDDKKKRMELDKTWVRFNSLEMVKRFSQNSQMFGGIGGKLIRKEAIEGLRFEEEPLLGEDT